MGARLYLHWTCLAVLAAGVTAVGCGDESSAPERPAAGPQAHPAQTPGQAPPQVRAEMLVSTDWLAEHLSDPDLVLLHVGRGRAGYDAGHIPGARFVGWEQLTTTRDGVPNELPTVEDLTALLRALGIDAGSRIVLYDEGVGVQAARGYVTLDYLGLGERAALLDGQLAKWKLEDRPLSSEPPTVAPTAFTPTLNPRVIADLAAVRAASEGRAQGESGGPAIIDARADAQYRGEQAGEGIERGGHIPGAASVFSGLNTEGEACPVFRSPEELHQTYQRAGVEPGGPVITYCRTGGQGSLAYFTAKYLGYDARLYDGSFWEWSHAPDTPVAAPTTRPDARD